MRKFSPRELNWLRKFAKHDCWWEVSQTSQVKRYGEMPVEYITGFAEFRGRDFKVNKDVLIPRVETEELIDLALTCCQKRSDLFQNRLTIADIGTGCGCIGITLYLDLIKLGIRPTIYLSDISQKSLRVAEENIFRLVGVQKVGPWRTPRSDLIILTSDLFLGYPRNLKFDLAVANPPYIPSARIPQLPESVRKFEPRSVIDGGEDGAVLINKLISQARGRLVDGGMMISEIDETHTQKTFNVEAVKELNVEIRRDQFGKNRFLILNKK